MVCRWQPACSEACINEILERVRSIEAALTWPEVQIMQRTNCDGQSSPSVVLGQRIDVIPTMIRTLNDFLDERLQLICPPSSGEGGGPNPDLTLMRIYQILGGDHWFPLGAATPQLDTNTEQQIKATREAMFTGEVADAQTTQKRNLIELINSIAAVEYHRSGHYRLPAQLPESLVDPTREGQKAYGDHASLFEWLVRQLDGLFGQFPITLKYKNGEGTEQEIKIENQAESVAEIIGLLLGIAADAEIAVQTGMKATTEAIRAVAASTLAADYARANADYLGYRVKEEPKDFKVSINLTATNFRDALKESTKKVQRAEFDDKTGLQDYLQKILLGTEIIKAAFYRNFEPGDALPGDRINEDIENRQNQEDQEWQEFIAQTENPPSRFQRDDNAPIPDLRNLAVRDPEDGQSGGSGGGAG